MDTKELQSIKNRFGIIGNDPRLNTAIQTAQQVASTNLSVLITGESGVGKEVIPRIIHAFSPRKHENYIAINCGAIPEGTIDSELFGHEKGAFTGANESRKGYFEVADKGTIFLDEVGELPLGTQVRLLRVLETGEFIRVGSSRIQKTDVRIIAATNLNFARAIRNGKFREDLYYRLNAVPVFLPPLRERKGDIYQLFRKFSLDFAEKYTMPAVRLDEDAVRLLENYRWPGNIRQLRNVAEQISILEENRNVGAEALQKYLPADGPGLLPVPSPDGSNGTDTLSDRDIIFKILVQLRREVDELKALVHGRHTPVLPQTASSPESGYTEISVSGSPAGNRHISEAAHFTDTFEDIESIPQPEPRHPESTHNLSIQETSAELIRRALEKHGGKRKAAAEELGISERTLYRKIKELNLN